MRRDTLTWSVLGVISGFGMALAAFLLIAPDVGPPPLLPFQDKIFHAVAFGCLTGPAVLALPRQYMWFWAAHMVALGAGIEVAQAMGDEGRSGDVLDLVADCVGIFGSLALGRWIRGKFEVGNGSVKPQTG